MALLSPPKEGTEGREEEEEEEDEEDELEDSRAARGLFRAACSAAISFSSLIFCECPVLMCG